MELTGDGIAMFDRLREVAVRHDERLRGALSDAEAEQLAGLLDRLAATAGAATAAPGRI